MKQITKTIVLASSSIFLTIALIKFPDQAFEASIRGLNMWWEVVFPSLLPFFITAELLISFGVVKFLGVLFEPLMRPLFNVPGVGSFAWLMGMASGYPTGAKISVRLRQEKQISQIEAERLVAFTNASSPLFIFGAISVGFFHDVKLGLLLAICHYAGNTIVGICMRFYGRSLDEKQQQQQKKKVSLVRAFKEMHETRMKDPRPFGEVFSDAVLNSITTLVMVGGFIILFSVLTKLFFLMGLSTLAATCIQPFFHILTIPKTLALPLFSGLFEITIGAHMISQVMAEPFLMNIVLISFILGFHGFSIQAQVGSIIAKTDIRFSTYFVARLLHGTFSSLLTIVLYKPLYVNRRVAKIDDVPVYQQDLVNHWSATLYLLKQLGPFITIISLGVGIIILSRRIVK
ncbi:MAG TPA: sporulation integral membrane protein YlbJ [Bacillota bacterium]